MLVTVSTLTVKQHFFVDAVGGIVLAIFIVGLINTRKSFLMPELQEKI
jgi:membrane-associated phospholipid phosphatase